MNPDLEIKYFRAGTMFVRTVLFTAVLWTAASGCMKATSSTAWPESHPLGRESEPYQPETDPGRTASDAPDVAEPGGVISLPQALALAVMHSPELKAFSWEVRASEARGLQAGLSPNPEIAIQVEEVGGTGERSGFDGAETTVQLGQLIELAGKRSKREQVASLERRLAGWDYEARRWDVLTRTTHAFVEVLTAQERLTLAKELVQVSEEILNTVAYRVAAGKDSPVEETKARVALAGARIEQKQAYQRLTSARKRLALAWGSTCPLFEEVDGRLDAISPIPSEDEMTGLLEQNPDVARWATEMKRRRAVLTLEKAQAIPDPVLFGGLQRFHGADDTAVIFGLSVPLGVSNRNQGRILEARYDLAKGRDEQRAVETGLEADLADAYRVLSNAFVEVMDLKNEVLPGATSALAATRRGYGEGKFDYLTVLDAQRTFFYAKARYIESLASYHRARADVERLIGQGIDRVKTIRDREGSTTGQEG